MTETQTPDVEETVIELVPAPKKHFPTKLVISLAAATAAVVVGGWLLSKSNSEEDEETETTIFDSTEDVKEETPDL